MAPRSFIKVIDGLLFNLGINKACGLISGLELVDYCKTCKAFDRANHQPWLQKLKVYSKDNHGHKRCQSYIFGRKQMVCKDGN